MAHDDASKSGTGQRLVNEEAVFYRGAYRVESPGDGVFLVRADDPHRAAEILFEDFLNYAEVDEAIERCTVTPVHDVEVPGLRELTIYPDTDDNLYTYEGEYTHHASYEVRGSKANVVGHSGSSEFDAVENLLSALRRLGVAGVARVSPPHEPETISLAEWRAREGAGATDGETDDEAGGRAR